MYELIRAIPESFSNAIGKQFEVVTLLVVRDIFKNLQTSMKPNPRLVRPGGLHRRRSGGLHRPLRDRPLLPQHNVQRHAKMHADHALSAFVRQKKTLPPPSLWCMSFALWSFTTWTNGVIGGEGDLSRTVFFSDFFTWLVMSDILILLISYKHTTDFNHLARNTGFVLSTVVIRWASARRDTRALPCSSSLRCSP